MPMVFAVVASTLWFWFIVNSVWLSIPSIVVCAVIWIGHHILILRIWGMYENSFVLFALFVGAIGTLNGVVSTLVRFVFA
jgi:hypothetical protein